ncbi:hypothetical protein B0H34DRAFT_798101 [Crassisporium funariophilum]|nr:hypothetical protein B0H34DRAFT_798101 [Crassisporium funariophilum]
MLADELKEHQPKVKELQAEKKALKKGKPALASKAQLSSSGSAALRGKSKKSAAPGKKGKNSEKTPETVGIPGVADNLETAGAIAMGAIPALGSIHPFVDGTAATVNYQVSSWSLEPTQGNMPDVDMNVSLRLDAYLARNTLKQVFRITLSLQLRV